MQKTQHKYISREYDLSLDIEFLIIDSYHRKDQKVRRYYTVKICYFVYDNIGIKAIIT